jgi:ATP-dependent RNA helicase SUPV3L1/SUV3
MRRLRENTMLDTEIGKTGEVIVEGHVIGRLDGFTFAPDAAEAGSEAKALQAVAQKALAGEIEARAEKLSGAPDDQFVLTSDGTIRWTGDAVARLVAADDVLHPRLRIISDERLTGATRDAVQARLDLWLKTHIEKLLGPLFELSKAEDVTGIARGIAFQLTEALGVLERQKIAAEMKDLDQPSRASLRKYGVRFGAYHIYFPALLKPAARSLASLLWASKQDNVDLSALSSAQHLAASGRTSFPADKLLDRDAYRTLGYRQCGERAVRVDILERLADLIRPALAWREAAPGEKPAGAFDGRGFVVTQAMTSLAGTAGEDFASILRALGYRMERCPAPPPVTDTGTGLATDAAAETVSAEAPESTPPESAVPDAMPEGQEPAPDSAGAPDAGSAAEPAPAADAGSSDDTATDTEALATEAVATEVLATETVAEVVEETPPSAALPADIAVSAASGDAVETAPADAVSAPEGTTSAEIAADASPAAATDAAPTTVEVWRPGGRPADRRPRHDRNRHRRQQPRQDGAQPVAADGEAGAQKRERHGRGRRERQKEARRPSTGVAAEGASVGSESAPGREPREGKGRPPRDHFQDKGKNRDRDQDKGRFQGSRKGGREGRPDAGPSHRPYASSAPRERERPMDPNSPFAKLAALREQLAGRKD